MIYIENAEMNGRIFYIQFVRNAQLAYLFDRLFVFATTHDHKEVGWAFGYI